MIRHDREADLERFRNSPHHGFFINRNRQNLAYTVMATGDDIVLEGGELDGGLGRTFLFSSLGTCGAGIKLGDSNNDNALKIINSRDIILRCLGNISLYTLYSLHVNDLLKKQKLNINFP